jgi:hypothetical protein
MAGFLGCDTPDAPWQQHQWDEYFRQQRAEQAAQTPVFVSPPAPSAGTRAAQISDFWTELDASLVKFKADQFRYSLEEARANPFGPRDSYF